MKTLEYLDNQFTTLVERLSFKTLINVKQESALLNSWLLRNLSIPLITNRTCYNLPIHISNIMKNRNLIGKHNLLPNYKWKTSKSCKCSKLLDRREQCCLRMIPSIFHHSRQENIIFVFDIDSKILVQTAQLYLLIIVESGFEENHFNLIIFSCVLKTSQPMR